MITIRKLVHGCWFGCDPIRDRDGKTLIFRCQRCATVQTPDLRQDTVKGVAHVPAEILGKPIYSVKRESTRTKIRTFAQGSRRP